MFNIIISKGNTNQNFTPIRMAKIKMITNAEEDAAKLEPSQIAAGNVNRCRHHDKKSEGF